MVSQIFSSGMSRSSRLSAWALAVGILQFSSRGYAAVLPVQEETVLHITEYGGSAVYQNMIIPALIYAALLCCVIFGLIRENWHCRKAFFRLWEKERHAQSMLDGTPTGLGTLLVQNGKIRIDYLNDGFFAMLETQREPRQSLTAGDASMIYVHADDRHGYMSRSADHKLRRTADTLLENTFIAFICKNAVCIFRFTLQ